MHMNLLVSGFDNSHKEWFDTFRHVSGLILRCFFCFVLVSSWFLAHAHAWDFVSCTCVCLLEGAWENR